RRPGRWDAGGSGGPAEDPGAAPAVPARARDRLVSAVGPAGRGLSREGHGAPPAPFRSAGALRSACRARGALHGPAAADDPRGHRTGHSEDLRHAEGTGRVRAAPRSVPVQRRARPPRRLRGVPLLPYSDLPDRPETGGCRGVLLYLLHI